jgi:hypothetical protein
MVGLWLPCDFVIDVGIIAVRRLLHLCALVVALCLVSPFDARAQSTLPAQRAEFFPLIIQGNLTGCQIVFSSLRLDHEYGGGQRAMVNGLLVFQGLRGDPPGAMLLFPGVQF